MTVRRARAGDIAHIESILALNGHARFKEIILSAISGNPNEYLAAVSGNPPELIAAYGMVAGTIGTASLYGVVPITRRAPELLSFVAHDLKNSGAQQIIAEFPDTDEFKAYRDVLLESRYNPTGMVEDFYRDGVSMILFARNLSHD